MTRYEPNHKLRALVERAGLSPTRFGIEADIEKTHLRRLLGGHITSPQWDTRKRIKEALASHGVHVTAEDDLGFGRVVPPGSPAPTAKGQEDQLDEEQAERLMLAAGNPSRLDSSAVEALRTILDQQRRLEDSIGSAAVLPPTLVQIRSVESMVTGARGPRRPEILDVAAQWAQFTGWLHASLGSPAHARTYWDRATEWAAEIGDANMIYTVLSFKGHLAWMTGDLGPMIGLSQAAKNYGRDKAGRAFDAYQEARGHALLGDAEATDRTLDEAAALASDAHPESTSPWGYYYFAPGFWAMAHGLALRYLGRCDPRRNVEAIEYLQGGLAELPVEMRRSDWAGEFVGQLAATYLQAGDHQAATMMAAEVLAIATETGSTQLAARVRRLPLQRDG